MVRAVAAAEAVEVAGQLEEDIVLGRLHPRERLVEDELMVRFDAKRHVVRAALQHLEHRGLAERRPNFGVTVKEFSPQEVENLYELRILLESNAARLIPLPVSTEDLEPVRQAMEAHRQAVAGHDLPAIVRANDAFHQEVFTLCGNPMLAGAIRQYALMAAPIRFLNVSSPQKMERSMAEHRLIVEALTQTDPDRLASLCRDHLVPSREHYFELAAQRLR